jgi:hypothetical protein
MSSFRLWLIAGLLLFALLESGKFLVNLHKQAPTDKEAQSLKTLTLVWLFLVLAQCSALFYLYKHLPTAPHIDGALGWWALIGLLQANAAGISLPVRPLKTIRKLMLYAIGAHGVLLLTWVLSLAIPAVPRTLPADVTLALAALAAISIGIFTVTAPREVRLAK